MVYRSFSSVPCQTPRRLSGAFSPILGGQNRLSELVVSGFVQVI